MKASGILAPAPSPGRSTADHRRAAPVPAIRIIQFVRTSAVAIALTTIGIIAHCAIELTHGRKGW